jgi:hypothetical protein
MSQKSALIIYGGWQGHHPKSIAETFHAALEARGLTVRSEASLEVLDDKALLESLDLICPCWTAGTLTGDQSKNLRDAVHQGTGLGGFHGGMGDAFRGDLEYEWMVGGHFVSHPHVGDYAIRLTDQHHVITEGFPDHLLYNSEQYYMLTDPANQVLIDSVYTYEGKRCLMPIVWTKSWGKGRVFYSALGHDPSEFTNYPVVKEMTVRGLLWAAGALTADH